jgi:deoxyribodipyrimidine photo-lyase
MPLAIWWIRRDLRLIDNAALSAALAEGYDVLPVFVLDPHLLSKPAPNRQAFLFNALRRLRTDLMDRGSDLLMRKGDPVDVLKSILVESGAVKIFTEEDYSPYAQRRDRRASQTLPLERVLGATVHHPDAVVKSDGKPYTVFTPFSKVWKALPFPASPPDQAPRSLGETPHLPGEPIPEGAQPADFPAGEQEANRRLETFLKDRVFAYANDRNRLDLPGTSMLSPYLRFGMISARRAAWLTYQAMQSMDNAEYRQGAETFLNELIWREFYTSILCHFPEVLKTAFNPTLRGIPWRDAPDELRAWQRGLTGVPVVDACMRQLLGMGWMHNRGRMIAASFLVKDLLINWQEGERWFMQQLVDGDPASNNGGWQWTAGVGTDAAPYFRIFNPVLQGKKHDPQGSFVRRWLPELARVPLEYLHEPWLMPDDIQLASGCVIGKDYPAPIVDHREAKERTLIAYNLSRDRARG